MVSLTPPERLKETLRPEEGTSDEVWEDFDITGDTDELDEECAVVDSKHLKSPYDCYVTKLTAFQSSPTKMHH
jgi:hypothetical protein